MKIASTRTSWGKKNYNNKLSALRRAFEFGYRDHPSHANPAWSLKGARMKRRDVPRIDPFRIQDAEALIAAIHEDWGERQGNFHECRFFTGLRPSEAIALMVRDFDEVAGALSITKARVYGVDRNMTKTREDRLIQLCPRAIAVLKRQFKLHRRLQALGSINHDQLFFGDDSFPIRKLDYVSRCWRKSCQRLGLRYRRPYVARHTSVSWNLVIGKPPLFVAQQHGHSVTTMFRTYAAWMQGAAESDRKLIRSAMRAKKLALGLNPQRVPHSSIEPVAQLATELATGIERPKKNAVFSRRKSVAERVGLLGAAPRPCGAALRALSPLRRSRSADPGQLEFMSRVAERVGLTRACGPRPAGAVAKPPASKIAHAILSNQWVRPHTLLVLKIKRAPRGPF